MPRYIDADNLIADFESVGGEFDVDGIKYIINTYHKPADVVPVVHGEWVPAKDPYDRVYCYRHAGCGCEHNEQSAYCPNCGAKMEDKS